MSTEYAVVIESFAERHFIKGFAKKYKKAWDVTLRAIMEELRRSDALLGQGNSIETIVDQSHIKIIKTEFRVASTKESKHSSGNRCIVALHTETMAAFVLLVYCKTDVRGSHETAWWQGIVRDNYPQYRGFF